MIGLTDLQPSLAPNFTPFQAFLIYFSKRPIFSTIQSSAPNVALYQFLPQILVIFHGGNVFILLNTAFAMAILDLISRVHLASFVITIPKQLKYSTLSQSF